MPLFACVNPQKNALFQGETSPKASSSLNYYFIKMILINIINYSWIEYILYILLLV